MEDAGTARPLVPNAVHEGGLLKVSGQVYDLRHMEAHELEALHLAISEEANAIRAQLEQFDVEREMAGETLPYERLAWRSRARRAVKLKKQQMTAIHAEYARRKTLTPPLIEYAFTAVYEVFGEQGLAQVQNEAHRLRQADQERHNRRGRRVSRDPAERQRVCGEKIAHESEESALKQIEQMAAEGADVRALVAYPCPWCDHYHVGHNKRKKRRQKVRERQRLEGVKRGVSRL